MACTNCQGTTGTIYKVQGFDSDDTTTIDLAYLCSIECLNEWAWKERQSRPKLSKSKGPT